MSKRGRPPAGRKRFHTSILPITYRALESMIEPKKPEMNHLGKVIDSVVEGAVDLEPFKEKTK